MVYIAAAIALISAFVLVMLFLERSKNAELLSQLKDAYDSKENPSYDKLLPYGKSAGHLVQFGHVWMRTAGFGGIDLINFMPESNAGAEVLLGDGKTLHLDYDSARCLEAWMDHRAQAEEDVERVVEASGPAKSEDSSDVVITFHEDGTKDIDKNRFGTTVKGATDEQILQAMRGDIAEEKAAA